MERRNSTIAVVLLSVILHSGCALNERTELGHTAAQIKTACENPELSIPVRGLGGIFWIPGHFSLSGRAGRDYARYHSECRPWITDDPASLEKVDGEVSVGDREYCQVCGIEKLAELDAKNIQSESSFGLQIVQFEIPVDGEAVPITVIYDKKTFVQIVADRTQFWRKSLRYMENFDAYINTVSERLSNRSTDD
ncbi:hypothetical protein [Wenzhouxiangella sp. EGI_FJ10409]|uniref:hypothetical protein n=1 Tax=Wenzhouxiangella sp. EGI_FJ10409 TaxID=3243767 RepID=UPI0035DB8FEC